MLHSIETTKRSTFHSPNRAKIRAGAPDASLIRNGSSGLDCLMDL